MKMEKSDPEAFDGFWYRVEARRYSIADEWGDHLYSNSAVEWIRYAVHRETPKGVWLIRVPWGITNRDHVRSRDMAGFIGGASFVLGKGKRQLACPTKASALRDAIVRKERHILACKARLRIAEEEYHLLDSELLELSHATS